jgi:hypothetical protein
MRLDPLRDRLAALAMDTDHPETDWQITVHPEFARFAAFTPEAYESTREALDAAEARLGAILGEDYALKYALRITLHREPEDGEDDGPFSWRAGLEIGLVEA